MWFMTCLKTIKKEHKEQNVILDLPITFLKSWTIKKAVQFSIDYTSPVEDM